MAGEIPAAVILDIKPFVVMAKPAGPACNLNCSYCYYLQTTRLYSPRHQFRMSDDLLETYIKQYITASPGPVVQFSWHGGEPTLAGIDFYRYAVALQKRLLPQGWSCWNNLQTNGILLNDDWCSFLAEAHFDVGLSIDGTRWLHDACRKDQKGQGTYDRVVAAVRRLQNYGIQPDLLCVVTSQVTKEPLGVYRALRDLNTGWIQFIPIVKQAPNGGVTSESVTGDAYGRFLCAVFDDWIHNDLGKLNVQFFAELLLLWSGGTSNVCWMSPTCGRVLVVEHDGSVYSCDHFVNAEHRIGSLGTSQLIELVDDPVQQRFGDEKRDRLPDQCRACPWLIVCNGGCPKDRFVLADNGETGLNYLCAGLRHFFAYSEKPLKKIIDRLKQGISFQAIMVELQAEKSVRWKGIGRNDPCPCGSGHKAKNCCWTQRP